MKKTKLSLFLVLIPFVSIFAQETFTIKAEYRFNPLLSDGFRAPRFDGQQAEGYANQRTRLILNYEKTNDFSTELIVQDLRAWGTYNNNGAAGILSVFRAWVDKKLTTNLSVKIGRQGFIYDDQYILGGLNWGGNMAHDAALFKYEKKEFKIHTALAYNANGFDLTRQPYAFKNHKNMQFVWIHNKFGKLTASAIVLNRGMEKPDNSLTTRYTQTVGTNLNYDFSKKFSLKGIYYHQFGKDTVGTGRKVNAYLASLQANYKLNKTLKFTLGADIVSGTHMDKAADPNYNQNNNFDILFGLRHGNFGYMDYFYVKVLPSTGLNDYYLKTKITLTEKSNFDLHLHSFMSNARIVSMDDGKVQNNNYGSEIDVLYNYKQSSNTKLTLGVSHFFVKDTYTDTYYKGKSSIGSSVVYAVVTFSPTLFKHETPLVITE